MLKQSFAEFSLHDDSVILRGHRIIIPREFRARILAVLQEGHYGHRKMTELARRYAWWPEMDADIRNVTRACAICLEHARNPPKEVIHPWHRCKTTFERIHMDFVRPIQGRYDLLIVYAYTRWFEAFICNDKTSATVLRHPRETIARFGLPRVMVTDNDPTFVSAPVKEFARLNGIRHMNSPPFHPASNGLAEEDCSRK